MRYSFFIFLLFFSILLSYAQQHKIDSLSIEFKKAEHDTLKARILAQIGIAAYRINLPLAKEYNDSLINFSQTRSQKFLTQGYRMRATFHLLEGSYDSSRVWYEKALTNAKRINNKELEASLSANLGSLYGRMDNHAKSEEYYLEAIRISKENNNLKGTINPLLNLAINENKFNNIEKSVDYLIQALEVAEKYNTSERADIYNQLAVGYLKLDNYQESKKSLDKALDLAESSFQFGSIHSAYGYYYEDGFDDFEKALYHYQKSIDYYSKIKNKLGVIQNTYNVGLQYNRLGNLPLAKENILKGLRLAEEVNRDKDIVTGNYLLAEYYAKIGDVSEVRQQIKKVEGMPNDFTLNNQDHYYRLSNYLKEIGEFEFALEMREKYSILSDSLFRKNNMQKIASLQTQYETEKKNKENEQLRADNAEQELLTQHANTRNWLLAFGLLAITVSAFFIWRRYKSEAKSKQIISQQKEEIEKLQREFHHRLKNDFRSINSYISLVQKQFPNSDIKERLHELKNRVTSMFKVHELLLKDNNITRVRAQPYLSELAQNVRDKFKDNNVTLTCSVEVGETIMADKAIPFGIVLNEFVTNSYKYAFDGNGGSISIDFKSDDNNHHLILKDNGKGLPENFDIDNLRTLGMSIVPMLAKLHDGSYELDGSNGVLLRISLPKKVA